MVVRLSEGRDAVHAYVQEHASRGRDYVLALLRDDNDRILALIGDLSEEQGKAVTPADEWSVYDTMRHIASSLERSKTRLEALSAGQPFTNSPMTGGQMGRDYASFTELRQAYRDGMDAILAVLERADPERGHDLTAEHVTFGDFNWLEWAVYSHHVHTHDHIGQIENIRKNL